MKNEINLVSQIHLGAWLVMNNQVFFSRKKFEEYISDRNYGFKPKQVVEYLIEVGALGIDGDDETGDTLGLKFSQLPLFSK